RAGSKTMSSAGSLTVATANPAPAVAPVKNVEPVDGPFAGSTTVTVETPTVAISPATIAACSWVAETNAVTRGVPLNWTTEEFVKFAPLTVNVKALPPACAEPGFKSEMFGASGLGFGVGAGVGVGTGRGAGAEMGSRKFPATRTICPPSVLK